MIFDYHQYNTNTSILVLVLHHNTSTYSLSLDHRSQNHKFCYTLFSLKFDISWNTATWADSLFSQTRPTLEVCTSERMNTYKHTFIFFKLKELNGRECCWWFWIENESLERKKEKWYISPLPRVLGPYTQCVRWSNVFVWQYLSEKNLL